METSDRLRYDDCRLRGSALTPSHVWKTGTVDSLSSSGVAAVVLAYHPSSDILSNIEAVSSQVARVYVVNNSPDAEAASVLAPLAGRDDVELLDQPGNVGVATGFNAGIRAALAAGFDDVWIFDQDTTVTEGALDRLIRARSAVGERAGVFGPALRSNATGVIYARESGIGAGEVDVLISSGSLFSRSLLEAIGFHDQPLFIDYVDHDICLRARARGYVNYKVYDAIVDHSFGDADPVMLLGRRVYRANYSPLRHFYSTRNRIIVIRRHGFGRWFWEDLWFTSKAWTKVLLIERGKLSKLAAAARGTWAGLRYPARELRW